LTDSIGEVVKLKSEDIDVNRKLIHIYKDGSKKFQNAFKKARIRKKVGEDIFCYTLAGEWD
jgi:hypothetical protein